MPAVFSACHESFLSFPPHTAQTVPVHFRTESGSFPSRLAAYNLAGGVTHTRAGQTAHPELG